LSKDDQGLSPIHRNQKPCRILRKKISKKEKIFKKKKYFCGSGYIQIHRKKQKLKKKENMRFFL